MKANMYYRETYPKELRIQIENEDELNFLYLLFWNTPKGMLKKFTAAEIDETGLPSDWKKRFIERSEMSDESDYTTIEVYDELAEEKENIRLLESAN